MIRTIGELGQTQATTSLSATASPVHRNGRTETEDLGPNHLPARVLGNGKSADGTEAGFHLTALRFYLVAALSLIEFIFYRTRELTVAHIAAATCLAFIVFGLQAYRINRTGFLGALLLYGLTTTAIAVMAMTTEQGIEPVMGPLLLHAILMISLYRNFESRNDLQLAENKH